MEKVTIAEVEDFMEEGLLLTHEYCAMMREAMTA